MSKKLVFVEISMVDKRPAQRCSYCHDDLANDPQVTCFKCKTMMHEACGDELGSCPTCHDGRDASSTPLEEPALIIDTLAPERRQWLHAEKPTFWAYDGEGKPVRPKKIPMVLGPFQKFMIPDIKRMDDPVTRELPDVDPNMFALPVENHEEVEKPVMSRGEHMALYSYSDPYAVFMALVLILLFAYLIVGTFLNHF